MLLHQRIRKVAKVYKPGNIITSPSRKYEILEQKNKGNFAISYLAKDANDGKLYHFKQYKSPSATTDWYADYVTYQNELYQTITTHDARHYVELMVDGFETGEGRKSVYHQVFHLIDFSKGRTLSDALKENPSWRTRQIWAISFLHTLSILHDCAIVHSDLKPDNIMLKPITVSDTALQLCLIDMDFSFFVDKVPPFALKNGYSGTPGYLSPEHIKRQPPNLQSDVFTAGIILFEILTGTNPIGDLTGKVFEEQNLPQPIFLDVFNSDRNTNIIRQVVSNMLHPVPSKRGNCAEIKQILLQGCSLAPICAEREAIQLLAPNQQHLIIQSDFVLNASSVSAYVGNEGKYYNPFVQCKISLRDEVWWVTPNLQAENELFINGTKIDRPVALQKGDKFCLGSTINNRRTKEWLVVG